MKTIQVGDRVCYARKFLKDASVPPWDPLWSDEGRVLAIDPFSPEREWNVVSVLWDVKNSDGYFGRTREECLIVTSDKQFEER
jgi:hypothetical protein